MWGNKSEKKQTNSTREVGLTLLIGQGRTGKSVLLKKMMDEVAKKRLVLFVYAGFDSIGRRMKHLDIKNPDALKGKKTGIYAINAFTCDIKILKKENILDEHGNKLEGKDKMVKVNIFYFIMEYVRNSLIVFDDPKSYVSDNIDVWLKLFLIGRGHKMLDSIFVYHSFLAVAPQIYNYWEKIILFRTSDNVNRIPNKIPFEEQVKQVIDFVDKSKNEPDFDVFNRYIIIKKK